MKVWSIRSACEGPTLISYTGTNIVSGETVAIKLESFEAELPYVEHEARMYQSLTRGIGIPSVHWFGTKEIFKIIVMDLLGPTLENLFDYCGRKFSLKTVLLIADLLISRIKYIYAKSFVYGDIKPENFLMGMGKIGSKISVISFDFAKEHADS